MMDLLLNPLVPLGQSLDDDGDMPFVVIMASNDEISVWKFGRINIGMQDPL